MSEPEELTRACPECGQANGMKHKFCEGCGTAMRPSPRREGAAERDGDALARPKRRGGARRRGGAAKAGVPADKVAKAEARREFARNKAVGFRLRNTFLAGILLSLVTLLLFWKLGTLGLDSEIVTIAYVIYGISLVLKIAGACFVLRKPLVWSVVIAAEHTIITVFGFWAEGVTLAGLINGFFVVVFWAAVVSAGRLQRVLDENPEFQMVRDRADPSRVREGGVAARAREMRAGKWKKILAGVAVLVGVSLAVWLLVWWSGLPTSLSSRAEQFRAAWEGSDDKALDRLGHKLSDRLEPTREQRGWSNKLPKLGDAVVDDEAGTTRFPLPTGELEVRWQLNEADNAWQVVGFGLPDVEFPPFDPQVAEFEAAWAETGMGGLMALLSESYRARRGASIEKVFEGREWAGTRPRIIDTAVGGRGARRTLEVELRAGDLRVRWEFVHPKWRITSLRLPRR